jgi:hypothetical protein
MDKWLIKNVVLQKGIVGIGSVNPFTSANSITGTIDPTLTATLTNGLCVL